MPTSNASTRSPRTATKVSFSPRAADRGRGKRGPETLVWVSSIVLSVLGGVDGGSDVAVLHHAAVEVLDQSPPPQREAHPPRSRDTDGPSGPAVGDRGSGSRDRHDSRNEFRS